jgi:hypothetical protein
MLTAFGSTAAFACSASRQLSDLGQAYETLLAADSQSNWQNQAARLSETLSTTDAATLGRDLDAEGAPADITRIARLFADASNLLNDTWNDRTRHTARTLENLTYIDRLLTATDCTTNPSVLSQAAPSDQVAPQSPKAATTAPPVFTTKPLWLLIALTLAAALGGATLLATRKTIRPKGRTKRLTRYPAVIPVLVTVQNAPPDLADTADISLGGVKLAWKNAPPAGTALTVDFSEVECAATVVWSNAHYAGLRFDAHLTEDDLNRIRNRNNNP